MCKDKNVSCDVAVSEIDNGYQITITGDKVKESIDPTHLKECFGKCCCGEDSNCCQ